MYDGNISCALLLFQTDTFGKFHEIHFNFNLVNFKLKYFGAVRPPRPETLDTGTRWRNPIFNPDDPIMLKII